VTRTKRFPGCDQSQHAADRHSISASKGLDGKKRAYSSAARVKRKRSQARETAGSSDKEWPRRRTPRRFSAERAQPLPCRPPSSSRGVTCPRSASKVRNRPGYCSGKKFIRSCVDRCARNGDRRAEAVAVAAPGEGLRRRHLDQRRRAHRRAASQVGRR
jgi:hypothetical protein